MDNQENQEKQIVSSEETEVIEKKLEIQLRKTNLTPRQLLAKNEVEIQDLRKQNIRIKAQPGANKRNLQQLKINFKKINDLKVKNRLLKQNIKREHNLYLKKDKMVKNNKSQRSLIRKLNLRKFEVHLRNYIRRNLWRDLLLTFIGSLIITIGFDYLINATGQNGLFPPGIGAIARQITIFTTSNNKDTNTLYFLYYIILNIPFFLFGLWKVGIRFSALSILGIAFQNLINLVLISLPSVVNPADFRVIIDYIYLETDPEQVLKPIYLVWLFVFAIIAACVNGLGYSFLYRAGGSSSGVDFVSGYYQKKYKISIASINIAVNSFLLIVILMIHTATVSTKSLDEYFNLYDTHAISTKTQALNYRLRFFFGPTTFASFLYIFGTGVVTNFFYPKFKFLLVSIYTKKPQNLLEALAYKGFTNAFISDKVKLYSQHEEIQTSCIQIHISYVDYKRMKEVIAVIDSQASFSSNIVRKIEGRGLLN